MFSCSNCLAGALRAVASESLATSRRLPRTHDATRLLAESQRRSFADATTVEKRHSKGNGVTTKSNTARVAGQKRRDVQVKDNHLRRELEYLPDPAKLADHIKNLLRSKHLDKALRMVQMAGNRIPTTVSWNHILNHLMGNRNADQAWKHFQEMKKRAQKPDSHTYTIMLRGFAMNLDKQSSLERAVIVYQSMFAHNSPVTPSLIHTNAMLHVCGMAKDLDTMFQIASKLPQAGRGAADATTFTTILHTIRVVATDQSLRFGADESLEMRTTRYEQAIRDGKRIWADVIQRWADGDLLLDEQLVCAMGRLLLLTGNEDNRSRNVAHADDILSLVEQAMGVPRETPKGSWTSRNGQLSLAEHGHEHIDEHEDPKAMQLLDSGGVDDGSGWDVHRVELETSKANSNPQDDTIFDRIEWKRSQPQAFARPGNNSFSLVLTACSSADDFSAASRYWNKLSKVVRPDSENCHAYLRILRAQRASRKSLELVRQMLRSTQNEGFGVGVQYKTFRIAMSACARDSNNPHALGTAIELLREMRQHLDTPDLKTVESFTSLLKSRGQEADPSQAVAAVDMLHLILKELKGIATFGAFGESTPKDGPRDRIVAEHRQSGKERLHTDSRKYLIELAKSVESATGRAISYYGEVADKATISRWHGQRTMLQHLVQPSRQLNPDEHRAIASKRYKSNSVERSAGGSAKVPA